MPPWSRSPEARASHLDQPTKVWVRWLFRCGLPLEHIATVIEVDLAAAAAALVHHKQRGGFPWVMPTAPPNKDERREARQSDDIHGPAARKVRRLHALHYPPPAIAKILDIRADAIEDFLRRLRPIRRAELVKTRTRKQQRAIRPPRPRSWRLTDARDVDGPNPGDPPPLPAADALLEVDELAELEVPPPPPSDPWEGSPSVEVPPAGDPWTGPATLEATGEGHGRAKLTWPMVHEVRRLHAVGWSCARLARQLGVHPGTITAIVKHRTWIEPGEPLPCPDADCSENRQKQGENGQSPPG